MKTPGSLNSVAPRTRNSIARSVFPQPAKPVTRVGRPKGRPPPVISSSPDIPVGHFGSGSSRFTFLLIGPPQPMGSDRSENRAPRLHKESGHRYQGNAKIIPDTSGQGWGIFI